MLNYHAEGNFQRFRKCFPEESQPQRRSADASAAESVAVACGVNAASMAWESQPEASKAGDLMILMGFGVCLFFSQIWKDE